VHLLGYQPYPAFCALAARADFGLSHFRGDSRVYFPNRVFDYFAADLPVLSTIPGELAEVLAAHQAGFTTGNFDADATVAYVERTLPGRPPLENRPEPRLRRGAWVERFDRPAIARRAAAILQALAAGGEILP
jgi:glycosyltransferase involved in cell wall biosynthesis